MLCKCGKKKGKKKENTLQWGYLKNGIAGKLQVIEQEE
jgi:hypothetical protein